MKALLNWFLSYELAKGCYQSPGVRPCFWDRQRKGVSLEVSASAGKAYDRNPRIRALTYHRLSRYMNTLSAKDRTPYLLGLGR